MINDDKKKSGGSTIVQFEYHAAPLMPSEDQFKNNAFKQQNLCSHKIYCFILAEP